MYGGSNKDAFLEEVCVEKGRLDQFKPQFTIRSNRWRHWVVVQAPGLCLFCLSNNGRIFAMDGVPPPLMRPPVHRKCRCTLQPMRGIQAGYVTTEGLRGADLWMKLSRVLPDYYIGLQPLLDLGWKEGKSPAKFAPGKMLTRGIYENKDGHLPSAPGRVWQEADINYYSGRRNRHRLLWSNDGLMFVTYDHYGTFYEIM